MQDNINSIILSFINKAQEEQQQQQQNNQNNNNSENDQNQQNQQNSSSSSPKNTTGLSQGSNSPAQNQSPKLEPSNLSEQPISGISLLTHPSINNMKRQESTSTYSSYDQHQLNPIDMDVQEKKKQERKRERNRIAAAKCRERKMTKINTLETEVKQMQGQIKNHIIEKEYYRNRCTSIVDMVNEYIKKGDTTVPIAKIQQIIETITDDERERMRQDEEGTEPTAKQTKYG